MGQGKRYKAAFLAEHPVCYFCAVTTATTIEHMPSRIAFPPGLHPEGYEFPACKACNNNYSALEQVVGLYITLFDQTDKNFDKKHLNKLALGVTNNNVGTMPRIHLATSEKRRFLREHNLMLPPGLFISAIPLARIPEDGQRALLYFSRKLTAALFYRVAGRPLPPEYLVRTLWTPANMPEGMEILSSVAGLFPYMAVGERRNVNIGNRFRWIWTFAEDVEIFAYCAVFGSGLLFTGAASVEPSEAPDAAWLPHQMDRDPAALWEAVLAADQMRPSYADGSTSA